MKRALDILAVTLLILTLIFFGGLMFFLAITVSAFFVIATVLSWMCAFFITIDFEVWLR